MSAREAGGLLKFGLLHVHAVVALRPEGQAFRRSLVQHISFVISVKSKSRRTIQAKARLRR